MPGSVLKKNRVEKKDSEHLARAFGELTAVLLGKSGNRSWVDLPIAVNMIPRSTSIRPRVSASAVCNLRTHDRRNHVAVEVEKSKEPIILWASACLGSPWLINTTTARYVHPIPSPPKKKLISISPNWRFLMYRPALTTVISQRVVPRATVMWALL